MVTIKKYTPAFVSGAEDIMAVASSKESLLEIPFVKSWMRYDTFREFRISEKHLMVFLEEPDGEWLWFVVGIFQHGTEKEAESWFGKADYSKYTRNKKTTQNRRDAEAGVILEEYDASIKDLDSATRCSKCRFLVCRPGVGIDDPRYWTAPWTCGRQQGCIFDANKQQNKRRGKMKATINGKRYDTSKCEVLGEIDHYDNSNNYSGTTRLIRASNGQLLEWCDSNGRDIYLRDYVRAWEESERRIDDFNMTDEQEARCAKLGLIEIVD